MTTDKARAKLSYRPVTQKITMHMSPDKVFTIPYLSAVGPMLGFRNSVITSLSAAAAADIGVTPTAAVVMPLTHSPDAPYPFRREGDNSVNMNKGFDTIYIYTNFVEYHIVGDIMAPLLRSLPVHGTQGAAISDRFNNIHYVSLLLKKFGTIEIDIREDTGRRVPFEYGRVTVTLHIRRRRTGLF